MLIVILTVAFGAPRTIKSLSRQAGVKADESARTPPPAAAIPIPKEKPATGSTEVNENAPAVEIDTPETETKKTQPAPASKAPPKNEGCVAIEHLTGYVLQHAEHLRRPVLCAHGFCATPNHAIIVDGEWTSMKRLCGTKWDCARSVKLVNNLLVIANRRAVVGQVTITPYDLRFPRWAVWVVQIAELLWNTVEVSVLAAFLAVGATCAAIKLRS